MGAISIRNVEKVYGHGAKANKVIHGVSAEIADGEFVVIVGPSGCGKSTLLRMVAGLEEITGGEIAIAGRVVNDIEPADRDIAMVFQNYALYPHMTVFDNMAYGLKIAKVPAAEIRQRVDKAAGILQLGPFLTRKPRELSGGQRQRVLFGISICGDPDLLFLDEPTVGLDVEARRLMWSQIRGLVARGKTVLLTTHYLHEADALADRILVLQHGSIVAEGTPSEIKARAIGKQVRFSSRLTLDDIRAIPGVLSASADRQKFELQVQAAEPVVRELLDRDAWLSDLEVTSAGLEEAFLALTQNHNSHGSN